METRTLLIADIKQALNIEGGFFTNGLISDAIDGIEESKYQEFFNALLGNDHDFLKSLDRVAKVSERFKGATSNELFEGSRDMAKAMYAKFYAINASMTTHSQNNRAAVPNDREFFENYDYKNMIDINNKKLLSSQEVYVLQELGNGTWLMDIKLISNSKEAVDKIENIIKTAITSKYMTPKNEAISGNIRKALGRVS